MTTTSAIGWTVNRAYVDHACRQLANSGTIDHRVGAGSRRAGASFQRPRRRLATPAGGEAVSALGLRENEDLRW